MKTILVVDDMAVFREPIAASLRLAGYETCCAGDGDEALKLTRSHRPDLILLDVSMPKVDGLTFLRNLRADPAVAGTRVILLTALTEKKYVLAAASFGVRDYLLKSRFRLADLLERVKKYEKEVAPAAGGCTPKQSVRENAGASPAASSAVAPAITCLVTRDQFLEKVARAFETKTLSGVVAQVISLASSPRSEMGQLASLISRDPMLSARILQTANSSAYTSGGAAVTTVSDAIRKVGCNTVRNIAAALGVFDCMPEASADGFNPIRYWQHSFAVAQTCERLASIALPDQSGLAYLAGLCHDLADIFIRTEFESEYQQVLQVAAATNVSRESLQAKMLGMTSMQMTSAVLKRMGLPDAIREPIELLHSAGVGANAHPITRVLWLAENYANGALLASSPGSELSPFTASFCKHAAGNPNPPQPDSEALRSEVLSLTVSLARLSRAEETKLLAPTFAPKPTKVWIARHSAMSQFDPIALFLSATADVELHNRLPVDTEVDKMNALVVIAPSSAASGFTNADIERALTQRQNHGENLSVLAVTSDDLPANNDAGRISWRNKIALGELAVFVQSHSTGK